MSDPTMPGRSEWSTQFTAHHVEWFLYEVATHNELPMGGERLSSPDNFDGAKIIQFTTKRIFIVSSTFFSSNVTMISRRQISGYDYSIVSYHFFGYLLRLCP